MKTVKMILPALVALTAALNTSAFAVTSTTNMQVAATVAASCTVNANTLAFGNYTGPQLDSTSTLNVNCTNGTSAFIGLNAGAGTAATTSNRLMTAQSGTNTLSYGLYQDNSRSTVFGNTNATGVALTGNGSATFVTVYGRIPANQTSPIGSYNDIVVVTVNY